jgi:hypothetical protein
MTPAVQVSRFKNALSLGGGGTIIRLPWRLVLGSVETWARAAFEAYERYTDARDLWEELRQSKELFAELEHVADNAPFTGPEQAQIASQMQQIRAHIIKSMPNLTADQLADVDERLDHIEEASRRLGRKDWLMLLNGAVFSLILTDLITPPVAQHILLMVFHGLGHLFGLGGPSVPLP